MELKDDLQELSRKLNHILSTHNLTNKQSEKFHNIRAFIIRTLDGEEM